MEEVTFEIILKRSHVWTGKDGVNMELILQAKAKKSREYICEYFGLAKAVLLKLAVHVESLEDLVKMQMLIQ